MFNSWNNNVSRHLLTVSALEHPASAGWNCGTSPLTPQGKWFMRLFKLGSVKGPLYWALKLMCQARLEPELTFGCPGWPFEINSKEHHSSCGAMAHLMDLKFNKHCHRMWESKLLVFLCFCNLVLFNTKTRVHRENNKQHLYNLHCQLSDWSLYYRAGRLLICSFRHSVTHLDLRTYGDICWWCFVIDSRLRVWVYTQTFAQCETNPPTPTLH